VARPDDYDDQNLTKWHKDPLNPVVFHGAHGAYAGPSSIWMVGDTFNLAMPLNNAIARWESTDPTLHNWTMADPRFYNTSSGPSEFFPLPRTIPGRIHRTAKNSQATAAQPTHVLAGIVAPKPYRGGTPWFVLGEYNPTGSTGSTAAGGNGSQQFLHTSSPSAFDWSDVVIFSQLHSDLDLATGEQRMLFMGWFNVGSSCLTSPREVFYDPELQVLVYTVFIPCIHIYSVLVHCMNTLYSYIVLIHCIHTVYSYTVLIYTLYSYTVPIHCTHIQYPYAVLYSYTVPIHCIIFRHCTHTPLFLTLFSHTALVPCPQQVLLSLPVAELLSLRGNVLGQHGATTLPAGTGGSQPGEALAVFQHGSTSTTFDMTMEVALAGTGSSAWFGAAIMASGVDDASVLLYVNVSAVGGGGR
jgi:hypothetical protein